VAVLLGAGQQTRGVKRKRDIDDVGDRERWVDEGLMHALVY
jgi:hypothetical protein